MLLALSSERAVNGDPDTEEHEEKRNVAMLGMSYHNQTSKLCILIYISLMHHAELNFDFGI